MLLYCCIASLLCYYSGVLLYCCIATLLYLFPFIDHLMLVTDQDVCTSIRWILTDPARQANRPRHAADQISVSSAELCLHSPYVFLANHRHGRRYVQSTGRTACLSGCELQRLLYRSTAMSCGCASACFCIQSGRFKNEHSTVHCLQGDCRVSAKRMLCISESALAE